MDAERALDYLRKEARSNKAVKDVFTVFAARQRSRNKLSLRSLVLRMNQEGYDYTTAEYADVMGVIAAAGIGKPRKDTNGRVTSISGITVDLKSLGASVIGDSKDLKEFQQRRKYQNIEGAAEVVKASPDAVKIYPIRKASTVSITLNINGKDLVVPIPPEFTLEEIQAIRDSLEHIEFPRGKPAPKK